MPSRRGAPWSERAGDVCLGPRATRGTLREMRSVPVHFLYLCCKLCVVLYLITSQFSFRTVHAAQHDTRCEHPIQPSGERVNSLSVTASAGRASHQAGERKQCGCELLYHAAQLLVDRLDASELLVTRQVYAAADLSQLLFHIGVFWRKNSGTSGVAHATPTEASLLAPPLTDTPNA